MRSSYAHRNRKPAELMLVPMIDIFTVLVTFLLMTAVFSRIAIVELDLPSNSAPAPATPPPFRLEVIVRDAGIELSNGKDVIAALPKVNGTYDLAGLTELATQLKREHPAEENASVLLEPEIPYDDLIQVMDAIRTAEVRGPSDAEPGRVALFSNIAVGDAP